MAKVSCVKDLKLLNPICAVAAELGLHLDGRRAVAPAAFGEPPPGEAFTLEFDPERHRFACDGGTPASGSVIDLVMTVRELEMEPALEWLQSRIDERGLKNKTREGIVLVDHGSRRDEANALLLDVAAILQARAPDVIVHIAHMELAEPTIAHAFTACVKDGAAEIVVHPYFLAPGNHAMTDIPAQAADAAVEHPDVPYRVSPPLGLHAAMADVILARVAEA